VFGALAVAELGVEDQAVRHQYREALVVAAELERVSFLKLHAFPQLLL
jgi:hypothetical protein